MSSILVHQSLHGYNDGHRLIASSHPLDTTDARIMLVMSDLSGPGVKPPPIGYLTGYPLDKSGRYVLARTWAAPEMPRPGCVWTHSLIIENADLARIVAAEALLDMFSRPTDVGIGSSQHYMVPVPVAASKHSGPSGVNLTERIEFLIHALYMFPTKQVVVEAAEALDDERFVTAIWMQQWPRLRRTFGFCTLSGMDRSVKGVALDLQFSGEKDRQLRSIFPNAMVVERSVINDGLRPLLADLANPGLSTLREFLRRTGGDVEGGRRAMLPLCELHSSLLESRPPNLASAVTALASLDGGKKQARSVRALVARQAMKAGGRLRKEVFEFLVDMLEQSTDPVERAEISDRLGTELWERSPNHFNVELTSKGLLSSVASQALAKMQPEQILVGIQSHTDIASDIVARRPDLMILESLWRIPEVDDGLAEQILDRDAGPAAQALVFAGRVGPAPTLILKAEPRDLIRALESDEANPSVRRGWLAALCQNQDKLAAVLATGEVKHMATILTIARQIFPDDVPNSFGEDPWYTALRSGSGTLDQSDQDFLAAFVLNRALGWKSKSQAELLRYSFSRVYNAFHGQLFSREAEKLASWRLEQSSWFDWDRCSRLIVTIAKRFVEHDLDPEIFGNLTDERLLERSLIDEAARTEKGRSYLKRVRETLKSAEDKELKARFAYIAKKL